jgi:hypothetical protein
VYPVTVLAVELAALRAISAAGGSYQVSDGTFDRPVLAALCGTRLLKRMDGHVSITPRGLRLLELTQDTPDGQSAVVRQSTLDTMPGEGAL